MIENYNAALAASMKAPQVVYFSTPTCGPCRQMKPAMRSLKASYGFALHELDATEFTADELKELGVRAVPHIQVLSIGAVQREFVGAKSQADLKGILTDLNVISDGLDFE